ncbi:hypothetical protein [Pseudomonas aeruginosa]|nr:hypothetical protein [Pseudomonas aeruginosa]
MNAEDSLKLARRFIELPVEKRRVFLETLRGEGIDFGYPEFLVDKMPKM